MMFISDGITSIIIAMKLINIIRQEKDVGGKIVESDGVVLKGFIWLRNQWWALVNTVRNRRVPQNVRKFLSS
jgi:hypothetical protein